MREIPAKSRRVIQRSHTNSLPTVRKYVTRHRSLDPGTLDRCFQQHILGADRRANAVFITRDARNNPAGAELRGTRPGRPFRGKAPGSRKARGGFWIARQKQPRSALIVESAIDALSAFQMTSMRQIDLFLSTAGLASRLPPWINAFDLQHIACGYDADHPGDHAARRLIQGNPNSTRIRPEGQADWNDCMRASKGLETPNKGSDRTRCKALPEPPARHAIEVRCPAIQPEPMHTTRKRNPQFLVLRYPPQKRRSVGNPVPLRSDESGKSIPSWRENNTGIECGGKPGRGSNRGSTPGRVNSIGRTLAWLCRHVRRGYVFGWMTTFQHSSRNRDGVVRRGSTRCCAAAWRRKRHKFRDRLQ